MYIIAATWIVFALALFFTLKNISVYAQNFIYTAWLCSEQTETTKIVMRWWNWRFTATCILWALFGFLLSI